MSGAGATVLDFAAAGGNVELVRELVGRGCDVNAPAAEWRGVEPFAATALTSHPLPTNSLTNSTFPPAAAKSRTVAKHHSLHQEDILPPTWRLLSPCVEEGCPLDVVSGAGATVLDFAAAGGNVELVPGPPMAALVPRGCDVNAVAAEWKRLCSTALTSHPLPTNSLTNSTFPPAAAKSQVSGSSTTHYIKRTSFLQHGYSSLHMSRNGCS